MDTKSVHTLLLVRLVSRRSFGCEHVNFRDRNYWTRLILWINSKLIVEYTERFLRKIADSNPIVCYYVTTTYYCLTSNVCAGLCVYRTHARTLAHCVCVCLAVVNGCCRDFFARRDDVTFTSFVSETSFSAMHFYFAMSTVCTVCVWRTISVCTVPPPQCIASWDYAECKGSDISVVLTSCSSRRISIYAGDPAVARQTRL